MSEVNACGFFMDVVVITSVMEAEQNMAANVDRTAFSEVRDQSMTWDQLGEHAIQASNTDEAQASTDTTYPVQASGDALPPDLQDVIFHPPFDMILGLSHEDGLKDPWIQYVSDRLEDDMNQEMCGGFPNKPAQMDEGFLKPSEDLMDITPDDTPVFWTLHETVVSNHWESKTPPKGMEDYQTELSQEDGQSAAQSSQVPDDMNQEMYGGFPNKPAQMDEGFLNPSEGLMDITPDDTPVFRTLHETVVSNHWESKTPPNPHVLMEPDLCIPKLPELHINVPTEGSFNNPICVSDEDDSPVRAEVRYNGRRYLFEEKRGTPASEILRAMTKKAEIAGEVVLSHGEMQDGHSQNEWVTDSFILTGANYSFFLTKVPAAVMVRGPRRRKAYC